MFPRHVKTTLVVAPVAARSNLSKKRPGLKAYRPKPNGGNTDEEVVSGIQRDPDLRANPVAPTAVVMAPPIRSQMVLSVGAPVKNREKSEPIESDAATPETIRAMPTTRRTRETSLFMVKGLK